MTDSNIVTFVSKANADPENYYGNVYHVELYPNADKELLARWEKARQQYAE